MYPNIPDTIVDVITVKKWKYLKFTGKSDYDLANLGYFDIKLKY